ncbi:MAG TPA: ABC transporter ATP-binding protein [Terriglobales bacterium]|nr:ABC transporter ATP-binding protein [Terriglobales bacterium]
MPESRKQTKARFKHLVLNHLAGQKGGLLVAACCTLLLSGADLFRPWPLKIIFDYILLNKSVPHHLSFVRSLLGMGKIWALVLVSFTIVLITVVKGFAAYSQMHITSRVGFKLAHSLRREIFNHLQKLSLSFHQKMPSGELLTNISFDTSSLRDVFSEFVLTFASELLTLIGMLVVMLFVNWKLSLIVVATVPPLIFLTFQRYRRIKASAKRQRKAEGEIASRANEVLSSILVVQAFGREEYEGERFENQSVETLHESIKTARMEAAAARGVDIIVAVGTFAVILVGSLLALDGRMTPGNVLVFASYMNSIYGPIRSLAKLSTKFSRAMVGANRISELLDLEPDVQDQPDAIDPGRLRGEIAFQNASFSYGEGRTVLSGISFRVSPGEHVALVGPSGSGKSTLTALILRFYDPQQGSITIDGLDLRDIRRDALRREIGIVLQDSLLFGTTVRENIAYGKLNASMEEIINAATAANAHDFIMELENGYDTALSERGVNLSGGQRQRIAIARTFIRDVPMLILDEPMTGLDVESEAAVRDALRRLMEGRTCILITHDLQSAAEADRILMLGDGRITDQGAHSELLQRNQEYRELWKVKAGNGAMKLRDITEAPKALFLANSVVRQS